MQKKKKVWPHLKKALLDCEHGIMESKDVFVWR